MAGSGNIIACSTSSYTELSFYHIAEQIIDEFLGQEPEFLSQAALPRDVAISCGSAGVILHTPLQDGLGLASPAPSGFRTLDALEPEHVQYFAAKRPKLIVVDRKSPKYITQQCRVIDLETAKTDKEISLDGQYLTAEIACSPASQVFLAPIMQMRPARASFVKAYDVRTMRCLPIEFGEDTVTGVAALWYPSMGRVAEEAKGSAGGSYVAKSTVPGKAQPKSSAQDLRDSQAAAYIFLAVTKTGELIIGDLRKPRGLIRTNVRMSRQPINAKHIIVTYDNRMACVWDENVIECYEIGKSLDGMEYISSSPVRRCLSLAPTKCCVMNFEQQRVEYLCLLNNDAAVFLPSGLTFGIQTCRCMCYDPEGNKVMQVLPSGQVFGWKL